MKYFALYNHCVSEILKLFFICQPHVRVWRIDSLETLKVVGLGSFQRGLSCIAFSVEVKIVRLLSLSSRQFSCSLNIAFSSSNCFNIHLLG